jgi:preprotein translocase subunit SecD
MRPGRQLAVLSLLFVVLYLLVFFAGTSGMSFAERLEPRLGLDLVGGSRVTFEARTLEGNQAPSEEALEQARQIIESRVNARGVSEAEVVTQGNTNIVISKAGEADDSLREVGEPAELRFRKLLKVTDGGGAAEPEPSPSASGTPSPGASPTPGATPAATASATAAPAPTATPAPTEPAAEPTATPAPSGAADADRPTVAAVRAKVGAAGWSAAEALTAPDASGNPALKAFEKLTPAEVAAVPVNMQFNVPQVSCEKLDARPPGSIRDEKQRAVACETGAKYLMDVAKVLGTDVDGASPQLDQNGQRVVSLDFSSAGEKKWTNLTREAYNNSGTEEQKCAEETLGDEQRCRVAVVLDNKIVSSPQILGVLSGGSQISGDFTASEAASLASQLRYGALPLTFEQAEANTISATLGSSQLRAGLLAAGIGMLLVIIYSFFYYRLLGTVIFLSLVLSALLVFGALVVLGRQIGFTLTLAGIAGFIVSLGVAADSFVIYFERLKDEIREGRTPRSAVPRAWVRARRTIISANTITVLAAVVLYLVSVGTVQGFAFALGLATILDLVVVFLFRHPIMAMFARTKAFLSPRVSGLGRVLEREGGSAPAGVRKSRPKEA